MPKSITLGKGCAVELRDQHVRVADVAMNHALLVRVMNRIGNSQEQPQSGIDGHAVLDGEALNAQALDIFHHDEWLTGLGASGI